MRLFEDHSGYIFHPHVKFRMRVARRVELSKEWDLWHGESGLNIYVAKIFKPRSRIIRKDVEIPSSDVK